MRRKRDRKGRKAYRTKSGLLKNTVEDSGIEDNILITRNQQILRV